MIDHKIEQPVRVMIFVAYNIAYVAYMLGYLSWIQEIAVLALFCIANALVFITKHTRGKPVLFSRELKLGLGFIGVFFVISIMIQMWNNDFQGYLFEEIFRTAGPLINAFLFINATNEKERDIYFNILLVRYIVHFMLFNINNLDIRNISMISWSDSFSPFESGMAHDFIILEFYYLYKKQKKKALVCLLFCMLSLKRISFFLAPIMFILSSIVPNGKPVKKIFVLIPKIIFIMSPFVILFLYSPDIGNWLLTNYNFDLNEFTMERITIFERLVDNIPYFNGFGSANNFLVPLIGNKFHNDLLRFYFEVTIIGVIFAVNNLVEMAKNECWSLIMMSYILLVSATTPLFTYFPIWITLYMVLADMNAGKNHQHLKG